jgi:hypothetical protein
MVLPAKILDIGMSYNHHSLFWVGFATITSQSGLLTDERNRLY